MGREEYPRPDFVRAQWQNLNGEWEFAFDDENKGLDEHWERKPGLDGQRIIVPFAFETEKSGIGEDSCHDRMWYKRTFSIPDNWRNKRIRLLFEAVDYYARVFVNGYLAGEHEGGSVGFCFDITNLIKDGLNDLTVYVLDPAEDETIPRGKQCWTPKPHSIWYTRTSGIWQSVWLEPVSEIHIEDVKLTPDLDQGTLLLEAEVLEGAGSQMEVRISLDGCVIAEDTICLSENYLRRTFDILHNHIFASEFHGSGWCWSPESPTLFDLSLCVKKDGVEQDSAETYFGMRKIHCQDGKIYLNNRPYYHKLVLDQGYWKESLLTAPSAEAFADDIKLCKAMGFNGCRKHQKVEDRRFLYWADHLGFLVWEEVPSAPCFTRKSAGRIQQEMVSAVLRDYNHPCITAWVPLNESWGVPHIATNQRQQSHSLALYHMIHGLDDSRPVISNDGWQMTKGDICAVHNYTHGEAGELKKYQCFVKEIGKLPELLSAQPAGRKLYADGFSYQGEPVMLTEFGGISFKREAGSENGWGYTEAGTEEEFLADYERVIKAVYNSEILAGYCYTQLTDVEQETNGLLTFSHKPKVPAEEIRRMNDRSFVYAIL